MTNKTEQLLIQIRDVVVTGKLPLENVPFTDIHESVLQELESKRLFYSEEEYIRLRSYLDQIKSYVDIGVMELTKALMYINTMIFAVSMTPKEYVNGKGILASADRIQPIYTHVSYGKMGDNLIQTNPNQAYLCYEQAEFLCEDEFCKMKYKEKMKTLDGKIRVAPSSIVIVSYNCKELMQNCLDSIRKYCAPGAYEVIVVDNASTDGVKDYLLQQSDIKLLLNEENVGFPKGCNMGADLAEKENDIFFLNNDTRMTPQALFWLRMGLYGNNKIGAVGAVSNYCGNLQQVELKCATVENYITYGRYHNVIMEQPLEERPKLCGFAMLIKREAWNCTAGMDEALTPGILDDDDLSLQILRAGYSLGICHNSFVYHAGSQSFNTRADVDAIYKRNDQYMTEKWGFDVVLHTIVNEAVEDYILSRRENYFKVLEINPGCGATLSHIKYACPNAVVMGVESDETVVSYAMKGLGIVHGTWRDYVSDQFDLVVISRSYSFLEEELAEIKDTFTKGGSVVC